MSADIFTAFLARCVSDSVNANHQPQEAIACEDCGGTGRAAYHVCRTDEECRRLCLKVEVCMGCLGTGKKG